MKRLLLIAPLLAGVGAVPAYAQPLGVTGRAELRLGYDELRPKITFGLPGVTPEGFTNNFGVHGLDYGAEIGADVHITDVISGGAYAGVDSSSVNGCAHDIVPEFGTGADKGCAKVGMGYTAGVRLGFDPGGGLLYVKGGYSHAKLTVDYSCINAAACEGGDLLHTNGGANGWHVGAGAELNIGRHMYVKGEYVHTQYNKMYSDLATAFDSDRATMTREQILFGVGLRFGGYAAPAAPPPPPPPPPVPATHTCPDGTVASVAVSCPPLAPPPAPPPPPPERGERG